MKITYKTQGTCSSHIEVEVEDEKYVIVKQSDILAVVE